MGRHTWEAERISAHVINSSWANCSLLAVFGTAGESSTNSGCMNRRRFIPALMQPAALGMEHEYGFGWHIHNLKSGGRIFRVFAAEGNGGQFVIVVPDLDCVVGITGGAYGEFDQWDSWELELVPKFIIPAAEKGAAR